MSSVSTVFIESSSSLPYCPRWLYLPKFRPKYGHFMVHNYDAATEVGYEVGESINFSGRQLGSTLSQG